jgi:hypothetical protein
MYLEFREEFELPINEVYSYFKTPADWTRLYGEIKPPKKLPDGRQVVYLKKFPFPLVAKVVEDQHEKKVRWILSRFWRGIGEIQFSRIGNKTVVEGYEYVIPFGFWILAPILERLVIKKQFQNIWDFGWNVLRKREKNDKH